MFARLAARYPSTWVRALLVAAALAVVLASNSCDVECELPDMKGPDGWRTSVH